MIRKNRFTIDDIINFNPENWVFRRSSGYPGYDLITNENNEQKWIYDAEFMFLKHSQEEYQKRYEFLSSFRRKCLPFGQYSEEILQTFLNEYFEEELNLS